MRRSHYPYPVEPSPTISLRCLRFAVPASLLLWALIIAAFLFFAGCAIAPMQDGSGYAVGIRMSGNGTSVQELTQYGTSALGFLGVPSGAATGIMGLIAGGLGIFGAKQQAKAAHLEGQAKGWDDRTTAATAPPPLPLPQAPPVASTGQGVSA